TTATTWCSPCPERDRLPFGLLVEAKLVSDRIGEGGERAHIGTDIRARREDSASSFLDLPERLRDAVNHDVDARALIRCAVGLLDPRSADASRIVKGQVAVAAGPHLPPKDARVERRGVLGGVGRDLQVTDLAMGHRTSSSSVDAELVAGAADRLQVARHARVGLEVAAEADDEVVDRPRLGVGAEVPDLLQDLALGDDVARVLD